MATKIVPETYHGLKTDSYGSVKWQKVAGIYEWYVDVMLRSRLYITRSWKVIGEKRHYVFIVQWRDGKRETTEEGIDICYYGQAERRREPKIIDYVKSPKHPINREFSTFGEAAQYVKRVAQVIEYKRNVRYGNPTNPAETEKQYQEEIEKRRLKAIKDEEEQANFRREVAEANRFSWGRLFSRKGGRNND